MYFFPHKYFFFHIISPALALLLFFPAPVAARDLSWTGCGITKKAFMGEIAKAYKEKFGTAIAITGGGATRGIRTASAGKSDMGGTCRHWLFDPDGSILTVENNAELIHVAWDALVVVTHPDNPVNSISLDDLKRVYDGIITSWKDLGGRDMPIALVTRKGKNSGVGHMFRRLVFTDPDYIFKARSLEVASTGPLEKMVEKTVIALGMDGASSARKSNIKILAIDGIQPTKENIAKGKYPLFRPLYIAVNKNTSSEVRSVIDFIMSEEGQEIISAQGTVNHAEGKELEPIWQAKKAFTGIDCLE